MEDQKTNSMGSNVENGYKCKPDKVDPNKPIMYYKVHLFVCDGGRCGSIYKEDYSAYLRSIVKEMGLDKGKDRIKITRSLCFGACRFKGVAVVYINSPRKNGQDSDAVWINKIDTFSVDEWKNIFNGMKENIPLSEIIPDENIIKMKVYD